MVEPDAAARGSRILVVDDSRASRDVLCHALEAAGYQVMIADSGAAAVDVAVRFEPALILLDVTMPGMDGFGVCRRLMQDETTQPIPIIFLTAGETVDSAIEGFRAGGVDFVVKPLRMAEVLGRIRAHLERVSLVGELAGKNAALEDRARQLEENKLALEKEVAERQRVTSEHDELADRLSNLSYEVERQGADGFRRPEPGGAARAGRDRPAAAGAHGLGPDHRRERHRQGVDRPHHPLRGPALQGTLRDGQLRRHPARPGRVQFFRPRARGLYRGVRQPQGSFRTGRRWHPLPRRGR